MSKFNTKSKGTKTINRAGGEAYKQSSKLELVSFLLTSFLKDKYYETAADGLVRLKNLITSIPDKKFIAKAAIYARNEFGMRSVTHALMGELVHEVKGQDWTKNAVEKVIRRPDDMSEIVAYYGNNYGKPIPNSLKKGISLAFAKFNEYQLAKYRGDNKDVKLLDLVNLFHIKPTKDQQETFKKLMTGELKSVDTWEAKQTKAGQDVKEIEDEGEREQALAEKKAENWKELVTTKKLGYFALLRNLRNIIEQAPDVVYEACELLTNEDMIRKSLVLPFRYLTAVEEIGKLSSRKSRDVIMALNKALDISVKNVPVFGGETLVVLDSSGSMVGRPSEVGSLFSAILVKSNNADFMTFSDDSHYQSMNPMDSTLTLAQSIKFISGGISGGTNFHSIFKTANRVYDRIIILSDMQGWMGYNTPVESFNSYCKKYGKKPNIYSFDLNGMGDMQFPENNVYCIAGFSEKIFSVMVLLEQDKDALIHKIEEIEL